MLTQFASDQQRVFDQKISAEERKQQGHFGTSSAIAGLMAEMFSAGSLDSSPLRILDAGAGVGTLSAAICQQILQRKPARHVEIELWENDRRLKPLLQETMRRCQAALAEVGHQLKFSVHCTDFIVANAPLSVDRRKPESCFHLAILNPPYFKVRKDSEAARAMKPIVYGQPNVYALFMAMSADLLLPGGELVAITPRSYFSGPYFREFRRWFFDRMTVRRIHVFESRRTAFRGDGVLQENVILAAKRKSAEKQPDARHAAEQHVHLTIGNAQDTDGRHSLRMPYHRVIVRQQENILVRVVPDKLDAQIVDELDRWPCRLADLQLKVSTGPVVIFRAKKLLRHQRSATTAPLFWMHDLKLLENRLPVPASSRRISEKPAHIEISVSSRRLLIPSQCAVLLKRFTSKEEKRRLAAAVMRPNDSYSPYVGLENHLNYIHRTDGQLTEAEAVGLAAYLNSALADRYFRTISGSTQVNAAELRTMPIPDRQALIRIGSLLANTPHDQPAAVEQIVLSELGLRNRLAALSDHADT